MARPLRVEYPDTFYHVLSRGVEKRVIFDDRRDFEEFLEALGLMAERFGIGIWSYVLMGNHYHLVVRTREANLSKAMQWLGLVYSSHYNRRHDRSGHLFQGRFKSFVIEEEDYLEQLILYVHRNPLRADLVGRLADYPWSSYRCLAYGRKCLPWLARREVLALWGGDERRFRRAVQTYSEEENDLLENLRFGLFLGGDLGFQRLRNKMKEDVHPEKPQSRRLVRSETVEGAAERFRVALGLSESELGELRRPTRRQERPMRDLLIYFIWRCTTLPLAEIGNYFGVTYSSVSHARARGEERFRANRRLRSKLERLLLGE